MFSQILAVVLLSCSLVLGDVPFPSTPDQFKCNVKITTTSSMNPFPIPPVSGTYYYDYPNMRERIDQPDFGGSTTTTLNLWDSMQGYQWNTMAHQCKCVQLNGTMNPATVPYGSDYEGTATVNGDGVTIWGLDAPWMKDAGMSVDFYVNSEDYVVRINTTMSSPMMGSTITLMDMSSYVVGAPAPSMFQPASYCNCPPPPPPPTAGSCPNAPGPVCQCAATSDLAFCTGANYPIAQSLDVAFTDSFVATAYKTLLATLPNPSQTCQSNFQAFLCAMYFPECAGNDIPIVYLPCPDLCPFCGCGDLVSGNCTAAPANLPCTQYGNSFCNSL